MFRRMLILFAILAAGCTFGVMRREVRDPMRTETDNALATADAPCMAGDICPVSGFLWVTDVVRSPR